MTNFPAKIFFLIHPIAHLRSQLNDKYLKNIYPAKDPDWHLLHESNFLLLESIYLKTHSSFSQIAVK
jgi:hypothetical protein